MIERARVFSIETNPWLPFPTPMQQTNLSGMQPPARSSHIVPAEPVLVPPVIDAFHVPGEHQQKRRQRTQFVNPSFPLYFHPVLDSLPVIPFSPPDQIHYHHPRVEITRVSCLEYPGDYRVRPEPVGEVLGEVGVAVLRCADDSGVCQGCVPEFDNVVDDDQVRVEINDSLDAVVQYVAEVVPGVVERVLQGLPDRRRD
ncbi:hypothetical protein GQ457_18G021260 [Hibiscus cannabinus]